MPDSPFINTLMAKPMSGEEIERRSFDIIDRLLPENSAPDSVLLEDAHKIKEWQILRRLVHTTGDPGLVGALKTLNNAVDAGVSALERGATIVVDAQMVRAGLSLPRLRSAWANYRRSEIVCHIADPDVAELSQSSGLPRSLYALRKARPHLDGGIIVFGNSPVALLELNRLIIEEGVRPAIVIGFPLGFVYVVEAKDELSRLAVPSLILSGNRGGSPLAVAAIHALCGLAGKQQSRHGEKSAADRTQNVSSDVTDQIPDAVILLGHGSRVPGAGDALVRVAENLRKRLSDTRVESCYMSRLGPHFPETFAMLVEGGARNVVVIPYFLFTGLHIQLDIPEMLQRCCLEHPAVRVVYGEPLGFHESLVDIVEERVKAASTLADVREIDLPPRDKYPVPPGQFEFVGMPPEKAAHWHEQSGSSHDHHDHFENSEE